MPLKYAHKDSTRRGEAQSLGQAIEALLQAYKLHGRLQATSVINNWEQIVGSTVAARTVGLHIEEGVLKAEVKSAPLRQQLRLSKARLLELIAAHAGEGVVRDIVFY